MRRVTGIAMLLLMATTWSSSAQQSERRTTLVNPFIGTGGHGHTFPGPSLPFGMIQPGPDTRLTGWDSSSGYHYSDSKIVGFSHTHLSGTGIPDYNDVLLMPTTKAGMAELFAMGADDRPAYASSFSHQNETASPGYYAVDLRDSGVRVELTTGLRVGWHRYRFPQGQPARVVLDLAHRDQLLDSSLTIVNVHEVSGYRRSRSWAQDQRVFFVIQFSQPLELTDLFPAPIAGPPSHVLEFGTLTQPLLVKVGISAVSVEGARKNLDAESSGWDFDTVRRAADATWEKELGRIRIDGGTHDQRVTFYTALYHAMLTPNVFQDADGQYLGMDRKIHTGDFTYYSVFSLWDTFRTLHPLLTLIDRDRTADFVKTMLRMYQDGGRLPVWELAGNETDTMIGYHAVPVIADAIAKGIGGFDQSLALDAMIASADGDRAGLDAYKRRAYIDAGDASESVSRTLEYAYDDWCIAVVANRLGHKDVAERFMRRAQSWKNLFDPAVGFMRARVDGQWFAPFDPSEVNVHYTEANAWQYSFFVPQDVDGLITAHGGDVAFAGKLDALFAADSRTTGRDQADITGLIGQYAHGNEPSHHIAYLYAFAGQPWKTQALVRRILDTMYSPRPDGEIGNDDCGQMSAWYVMSALGFYPVTPGSDEYVVGAPLFPRATIGKLTITATNAGPYIQSARFKGASYTKSVLNYRDVIAGGELDFVMGQRPNQMWGSSASDRPSRAMTSPPIVPVPFVTSGSSVFRDQTTVSFGHQQGVELQYTTRNPATWKPSAPVTITDTTTFTVLARRSDGDMSLPFSVTFHKIPDGRRVTLSARYANQYNAGGDDALIDTLRGGSEFRSGRWQGYLGTDLVATVDLGSARELTHVAMGFLQDVGSWIVLPRRVRFEASEDGVTYRDLGAATHDVSDRDYTPLTRDLGVTFAPMQVRCVRVTVERYGRLPDWHPGKGNESWFFADEIVIDSKTPGSAAKGAK
jgi:predicted alpha-1,2-mannosidase